MTPQYVGLSCRGVDSAKKEAETDTQFTSFDSSDLKKQLLIFNPCGVALGDPLVDAYLKANMADRVAAFGGWAASR